ncbi:hypothetical protein F4Y59_12745 [Candidatus Poribacteria bacterium]|nr:hypothetical protein [Candidatus Poribacteria bacterium]MXY29011.1 hypothetical protein [Candidatus Poribacteria bacterium]MYK20245.1 hypothetical protein [Candidatus Poribacteria bacterium]
MAIRQGTATTELFIRRYTQSGDFERLARWHAAAAECLKHISVPMNEIAYDYYKRNGYEKWAARAKKEAQEIQKQFQFHRTRAQIARQKLVEETRNSDSHSVLDTESENIKKFITTWLPHYPDRFYEFGIYPTFFRKQRELVEQRSDYVKVLQLEADAAEMCAAQYERIPVAYGLKNYEKHRDAYRQYAAYLRSLAQQDPKALPSLVDQGKRIADSLAIQDDPSPQKAEVVLQIAKSDARVKVVLAGQRAVHSHATFQGFAWIVHFSNHSRGNIAVAIVDGKTAKVLEVF